MNNSNNINCQALRKERNKKLNRIHEILEEEKYSDILAQAEEINNVHNDSAKMYKAVKDLQRRKQPKVLLLIETGAGVTTNDQAQTEILANFFKDFFNKTTGEIILNAKPSKMRIPFSEGEVKSAIAKLKRRKTGEHKKYAPCELHQHIAKVLNEIAAT